MTTVLVRFFTPILVAIALILSMQVQKVHAEALVIGLIPEQNVFKQTARYKPLGEYLQKKTGVQITFTMLSRYGNIIDHFINKKMDGAFWGSFTGSMAITKLGLRPVARPLWKNGVSTYHGLIFVRKDSGIKSVEDMKGKRLALVDRATTAGYIFPLAWLKERGVTVHENYFREVYFTGSHDAAILAVLSGEADVGAAKNTIWDILSVDNKRLASELVVLGKSSDVPSNALGLSSSVSDKTAEALRDALLGMDSYPEGRKVLDEFGALKFLPTVEEDYKPVFDMAEKAGIDLKNYTYENK